MSRFGKVLLIIALVVGVMLLITYLNPGVKSFALGLAKASNLPLWLIGLAAPILYAFKGLANLLGGLVGEGATEKAIREKNEAISARLDGLEQDVKKLDDWRTREIAARMDAIQERERQIAPLEARARSLDQSIAGLVREREQIPTIQDDPGLIE